MEIRQFLSQQTIVSILKEQYGIALDSLLFLPIGADLNAAVYKAEAQGKSYFIKVKRDYNYDISLTITLLLDASGVKQVILPIRTANCEPAVSIENLSLIVYPFIEGEDGFKKDLSLEQWFILGKALRQVHEIELPTSLRNKIRRETFSNVFREQVKTILSMPKMAPKEETSLKLITFLKEKRKEIERLVEQAEALSIKLKDHEMKYVLCHSDIHGGNVLIDEKNSIYIVDWDEPILAPKERDLMFIGGGVANVWNKPEEEVAFYKGYGLTEINNTLLAYYRHERILEDIAIYCQEILYGADDKEVHYYHFISQFAPNGVVEIAFRTPS